jgi:hypothetical protein
MTQQDLDRAVAGATGESLRTVRRLGFTLVRIVQEPLRTDDPLPVVAAASGRLRCRPEPARCSSRRTAPVIGSLA